MGTNYYLQEKPPCECCGRPFESLHIGKSSAGWCFSLHVIPEEGLNSLEDWLFRCSAPGAVIRDEYGEDISVGELQDVIMDRYWPRPPEGGLTWYRQNGAEPGPNNLARHSIDGSRCVGHGPGPWDYITGEFF